MHHFPEGMLERCSRADKAVAEMHANGVSTRKVERIAQRMRIDRLSSSQAGRICKRLDAEVAALRAREFGRPCLTSSWMPPWCARPTASP